MCDADTTLSGSLNTGLIKHYVCQERCKDSALWGGYSVKRDLKEAGTRARESSQTDPFASRSVVSYLNDSIYH